MIDTTPVSKTFLHISAVSHLCGEGGGLTHCLRASVSATNTILTGVGLTEQGSGVQIVLLFVAANLFVEHGS